MKPKAYRPSSLGRIQVTLFVAVSCLLAQELRAASDSWDGSTTGAWATNTNWTTDPATVPGTGETATFNGAGNGNTTIDLGAGVTAGFVIFDTASAAGYTIGSGAVGSQTLTLDGNTTANLSLTATVSNAQAVNANITASMSGNTMRVSNLSTQALAINGAITSSSTKTMNVTTTTGGGNVTFNGGIGDGTAAFVVANIGSGNLTLSGSGTSTLSTLRATQAGAKVIVNGQTVNVASQSDYANGGILEVQSGSATFSNNIRFTSNTATNGVNVTGGTLSALGLTVSTSSQRYNFTLNGASAAAYFGTSGMQTGATAGTTTLIAGTLGATGNWSTSRAITLNSAANGSDLFIKAANEAGDTANNITLSGTLIGTGGFTKTGAGTLTISNNGNIFTGSSIINDGTLLLSGAGSIGSSQDIVINGSNAKLIQASSSAINYPITLTLGTLDGTGTVSDVTVADDAANVVANGNGVSGALTLETLTFSGEAVASLKLNGSSPGLNVIGDLATTPANGQVLIEASNTVWASGLNDLISFGTQSFSLGDFALGTVTGLGGRQVVGGLQINGNAIALNIVGDTPVWTGINGAQWIEQAQNSPTSGAPNFALKTGHTAADSWSGDSVEFNDTYNLGSGNVGVTATTVTIHGGVNPNATTFNHSAVNYTLATDDATGISSGSLIKSGSGTLTINTANSYSGGTTVNAGAIVINSDENLGSAAAGVAMNGGTLHSTADIASTRNFQLSNTNSIEVDSGTTHTIGGVVSNGANPDQLIKSGAGTLVLSGANSYTSITTINAGVVSISADSGLGGAPASPIDSQLEFNSGTLNVTGSTTLSANRGVTLGAGGGTFDITSGTTTNIAGRITGTGNLSLTSSGNGRLAPQNTSNDFVGTLFITGGGSTILNVNNGDSVLGNPANGITLNASGTIQKSTTGGVTVGSGRTITVGSGNTLSLEVSNSGGVLTLSGPVVGTGGAVVKTGPGSAILGGGNTYTGDTTVSAGTLTLANGGSQGFVIGGTGVNNKISGAGSLNLNGTLLLNLTGAGTTVGDSWTIIDHAALAAENYGGTFAVTSTLGSFTNNAGNWTITENGVIYRFSQSTGVLSVVPAGGYSSWSTSNAGGQTADVDFDSDGVDNGVEYFMNSAAGFTTNPGIVAGAVTWPNGGNIPSSAYGTQFVLQTSSDLATWTNVPVGSLTANTDGPGGSLTYTLPTGASKFFVRLVVTPN